MLELDLVRDFVRDRCCTDISIVALIAFKGYIEILVAISRSLLLGNIPDREGEVLGHFWLHNLRGD